MTEETKQPEALRLADEIEAYANAHPMGHPQCNKLAAEELRHQHTRIAELESENRILSADLKAAQAEIQIIQDRHAQEIEAIGAGGVQPLRDQSGMQQIPALASVVEERQRQVRQEGWSTERDDGYRDGELALAGSLYALCAHSDSSTKKLLVPAKWPWPEKWWKPTTPRRDLVKAGALMLAEIERLDRAAIAQEGGK